LAEYGFGALRCLLKFEVFFFYRLLNTPRFRVVLMDFDATLPWSIYPSNHTAPVSSFDCHCSIWVIIRYLVTSRKRGVSQMLSGLTQRVLWLFRKSTLFYSVTTR